MPPLASSKPRRRQTPTTLSSGPMIAFCTVLTESDQHQVERVELSSSRLPAKRKAMMRKKYTQRPVDLLQSGTPT